MEKFHLETRDMEKLREIVLAFYQADRLSGTVKMKFGLRTIADSDGRSVIDVYVSPRDEEAAETLNCDEKMRHMQFLDSMVPATLLGYQFILKFEPTASQDGDLIVLDVIGPALQSGARTTGQGLVS